MEDFSARFAQAALALLSPPRCALCGLEAVAPVCDDCLQVCTAATPACQRCALPVSSADIVCGHCRTAPPAWSRAAAALRYTFPVDAVLARLKYRRDLTVAPALEAFMRPLASLPWLDGATIVPLPLHRRRERSRGFNQATLLAAAVASVRGLALRPGWLRRRRHTPPQVGLPADRRRRNLESAFEAPAAVSGRHVVLVDDVMTTGATLEAASLGLRLAGAARVDCLVLARAVSPAQAGA